MEEMNSTAAKPAEVATSVPRLRDWLWRSGYAKLWWTLIIVFQAILLFGRRLGLPAKLLTGIWSSNLLGLALHPFSPLFVLGSLFLLSQQRHRRCENERLHSGEAVTPEETEERLMQSRHVSWLYNPADPRSPFNPENPMKHHRS